MRHSGQFGNRPGAEQFGAVAVIFAILLNAVAFLLFVLDPDIRNDRKLLSALWITLCVRCSIGLTHSNLFRILPSMYDDLTFYRRAAGEVTVAQGEEFEPYLIFLQQLFGVMGHAQYLGVMFSVLAYVASVWIFLQIVRLLEFGSHRVGLVLLFGLHLSCAIHSSMVLRESFQILTFLGILWSFLLIQKSWNPAAVLLLLLSLAGFTQLHTSFSAVGALLLGWGLFISIGSRGRGAAVPLILGCLALPFVVPVIARKMEQNRYYKAAAEGTLGDYAATYRANVTGAGARSEYGVTIDPSSPGKLVVTLPLVVLQYMFAPFPWQIRGPLDVYAFAEACLRFALLWFAWKAYLEASPTVRRRFVLIAGSMAIVELVWSTGTTNWGTGSRHHLVALPGYILLGGSGLLQLRLDPAARALEQRRQRRLQRQTAAAAQNQLPSGAAASC